MGITECYFFYRPFSSNIKLCKQLWIRHISRQDADYVCVLWLNSITDIQNIRRGLYVNCCHKWITFVVCRNADGLPWQPRDGDRISDHFVSKEKSDVPSDPNHMPPRGKGMKQ